MMKKMLSGFALTLLIVLLPMCGLAANSRYTRGDTIQDFTFSTYDGQQHSFYKLLGEKDAILLNIWASWCGPCRQEFPSMQEAYNEYRDRVEIVALSCEATDTPTNLASFAAENGLTFMIGQAPEELLTSLGVSSIPVSLMIDRYGTICFMEAGAQPNTDSFRRLFEAFIGEEYSESLLLDAIPSEMPNVEPSSASALAEALGCTANNSSNRYAWPMIAAEKDGRQVLTATNSSKASTRAEVSAEVEAHSGDAIVITFKTSTEPLFDLLSISVNGKTMKHFGGEHDWMSYAIPVDTDGRQLVKICYTKDQMYDVGEDTIWVDSITVVKDAHASITNNPVYPASESTELKIVNAEAREITISDPYGALEYNFGKVRCYIVNADTADVRIHLSQDVDPECALVYFSYDKAQYPVTQIMTLDGYAASTKLDTAQSTGSYCTFAAIYPDVRNEQAVTTLLFRDEENLSSFVDRNSLGEWSYAEQETIDAAPTGITSYTLLCVDQLGNPVESVLLQVCNDDVCQVFITDSDGKAAFDAEAYPWEIHILQAPEQYAVDPSQVVLAPAAGGATTITLPAK